MRRRCKVPCTSSHPLGSQLAGAWDPRCSLGCDWRFSTLLPSAASASNNPVLPKEVKFLRKSRYLADQRKLIGPTCMLVLCSPSNLQRPPNLFMTTNISFILSLDSPPADHVTTTTPTPWKTASAPAGSGTILPAPPPFLWRRVLLCFVDSRSAVHLELIGRDSDHNTRETDVHVGPGAEPLRPHMGRSTE